MSHHCNVFRGLGGPLKSKVAFASKKTLPSSSWIAHLKFGALHRSWLRDCIAIERSVIHLHCTTSRRNLSLRHGSLISVHGIYSNARACCSTLAQILTLHNPQSEGQDDLDPSTTAKRHVCRIRCHQESRVRHGRLRDKGLEARPRW